MAISPRVAIAWLLTGLLAIAGIAALAGASLTSAAVALTVVYALGYVVGSLLIKRVDEDLGLSVAGIRTVAGLLLTTLGFLLCLVLSIPWFIGPAGLLGSALIVRGKTALLLLHVSVRRSADGIAAGLLAAVIVSPILITALYMSVGTFPPVFYNIDTAYHLEKVHALATTDTYPPASLSNVGVRRTYHYGTQAMAALISRSSGLLPHHSMFLVVLPLLTAGVVAAASAAARYISPALPRSITIPLLLISTPSLSNPFWDKFGSQLWTAATSSEFSLQQVIGEYALWGILSNEGPNVGGDFVILGSVVGIAAAPSLGWRLAALLVGSGILVKTTVGVALVAGFALSEAWRAVRSSRPHVSPQMMMTAATFAATVVTFFLLSFESNFRVDPYPLFHLRDMAGRGNALGMTLDIGWLLLPVLIIASARIKDPGQRSAPILALAVAPVIVVNATRMDNTRAGGGGTGDDWFQILHAVPFLMHAFALSLASRRWARLGRGRRAAFLVTMALVIGPVAAAAAHYSVHLLRDPESGNDFVDNRSLAEALAAIPRTDTIVVTNDLRYPAGYFTRDFRQMQIPALFGHQAFAVNYAHEAVEERRALQVMLQQPTWGGEILEAARMYHWTHLLIRKDYARPNQIPLEQIFENEQYAVFRFR